MGERWPRRQRVALITGGASGIGLRDRGAAAETGWKVAIVDRDEAALEPARTELGADKGVLLAPLDVTDDARGRAGGGEVVEALGGIDGVVNSAGIAADKHVRSIRRSSCSARSWTSMSSAPSSSRGRRPAS